MNALSERGVCLGSVLVLALLPGVALAKDRVSGEGVGMAGVGTLLLAGSEVAVDRSEFGAGSPAGEEAREREVRRVVSRLLEQFAARDTAGIQAGYAELRAMGLEAVPTLAGLLRESGLEEQLIILNALDGIKAAVGWEPVSAVYLAEVLPVARGILAGDTPLTAKKNALSVLEKIPGSEASRALLEVIQRGVSGTQDEPLLATAVGALGRREAVDARFLPDLLTTTRRAPDEYKLSLAKAGLALEKRHPDGSLRKEFLAELAPAVERVLADPAAREEHRIEAALLAPDLGSRAPLPTLRAIVKGASSPALRRVAIRSLGKLQDRDSVPLLEGLRDDPAADRRIRKEARIALRRIRR